MTMPSKHKKKFVKKGSKRGREKGERGGETLEAAGSQSLNAILSRERAQWQHPTGGSTKEKSWGEQTEQDTNLEADLNKGVNRKQ